MALDDIHLRFTRQAWHVWHWAGSGGALGSHVSPWSPRLFAWQAWHLATCSCTLRGRRGTLRHPPSFHVAGMVLDTQLVNSLAGVALCDIHLHFVWQAWHLSTHGSSLCVAGVALMALGWLWWRAWFPGRAGTPRRFAWQAWHFVTSTFTLCGRRGTCQHMDRHFAWQAWHLWHWVGSDGALGSQAALGRRGVLRGRRGTL